MKDVLSREQMIELINAGYDIGEHTWHHALINNHLLNENQWVVTSQHLNRGDRLDVSQKEGPGFKTTVYNEVIDVIPTLTVLEVLDRVARDPKANDFGLGIEDKTWHFFDGNQRLEKSPNAIKIAFAMLKRLNSK